MAITFGKKNRVASFKVGRTRQPYGDFRESLSFFNPSS